jgi:hypothetical protein
MQIRDIAIALALQIPSVALAGTPTPTNGAGEVEVILKDHRFTPSEIHVAAGKRTQLLVKNQDSTADEFDSTSLKVEKVIGGNSEGDVRLRALDPGRYPFMGEFHAETAQGVVIAE